MKNTPNTFRVEPARSMIGFCVHGHCEFGDECWLDSVGQEFIFETVFEDRNDAVLALDRYKISQLPALPVEESQ